MNSTPSPGKCRKNRPEIFYSNTFLHNFLIFDSGVDHNMFLQPQSFHNKLFITIYVTVAEGMLGKGSRE